MNESSAAGAVSTSATIATRHGFPAEAGETLAAALRRGGGRQAQFSHPALGGMGQWARGGGIMIGAMFDHGLKARVDALCRDLAAHVDDVAANPGGENAAAHDWWGSDLGSPSSVGSQNDAAYAFFRQARRLAVRRPGGLDLYDTGDHVITGASQAQRGGSRDLFFTSQHGTIGLDDLRLLEANAAASMDGTGFAEPAEPEPTVDRGATPKPAEADAADILGLLERLFDLQRKGVLTADEFAAKKRDLLARL